MTAKHLNPPAGAVGRADLLRLLAAAPRPRLTLDDDGEHWFGYIERQESTYTTHTTSDRGVAKFFGQDQLEPASKLPLRMPFLHAIVERQSRPMPQTGEQQTVKRQFEPIKEEDAESPTGGKRLINYEDLIPQARLMPALRRQLSANRLGGLDVPRLVGHLAGRQMPRHPPRQRLPGWHLELVVVLDFSRRLQPYREDMHRLAERLLKQCGRSGLSLRIVNHGPLGTWSDWQAEQKFSAAPPPQIPWRMPPAATPVLLVSDLGLLEGWESGPGLAWRRFIAALLKAQTRPLALLPLGAEQLHPDLPSALTLLRWSPDARGRPERPHGGGQPLPPGLDDLLAMAAATRRVDPPLLRALRRINPQSPLNAGLEGAFWNHADVQAGTSAVIKSQVREPHLQRFAAMQPDYQARLEQLRYTHHAHLRAVLNHEESLLWLAHAGDKAALSVEAGERMEAADKFMHQLASTLQKEEGEGDASIWWRVTQELLQRADPLMVEKHAPLLTPLAAALARAGLPGVPDTIDPAALAGEQPPRMVNCWLVRDIANGCLLLQAQPPSARQMPMAEPILIDAGGYSVEIKGKKRWFPDPADTNYLCDFKNRAVVKIVTSREIITIAAVNRPRGASGWGLDEQGIYVQAPKLFANEPPRKWQADELEYRFADDSRNDVILIEPGSLEKALQFVIYAAGRIDNSLSRTGKVVLDNSSKYGYAFEYCLDAFGVLAVIGIKTRHGSANITLRRIEPGTFLMGSPEDDPERLNEEGPRHQVTLTQGFWLAETACTQAFWQTVMGNNPSRFKDDPQCPVEQVSWYQVQEFLRKVEELLPGCRADLPTEAEWEYACRAGTATPFSFGENITPEQVNYWGDATYNNAPKGLNRQKTVPVKSLPANPWGLHEMHGNVWEWCADGPRDYDGAPQRDPVGPADAGKDTPRAARGGSWYDDAWRARSAYRGAGQPGYAVSDLGFRLCLRSIEPGPEQVWPGGPAGLATGGSPGADNRPSPKTGIIENIKKRLGPSRTKKPKS